MSPTVVDRCGVAGDACQESGLPGGWRRSAAVEFESHLAPFQLQRASKRLPAFDRNPRSRGLRPCLSRAWAVRMPMALPAIVFQIANRQPCFQPLHPNDFSCSTTSEPQSGQRPERRGAEAASAGLAAGRRPARFFARDRARRGFASPPSSPGGSAVSAFGARPAVRRPGAGARTGRPGPAGCVPGPRRPPAGTGTSATTPESRSWRITSPAPSIVRGCQQHPALEELADLVLGQPWPRYSRQSTNGQPSRQPEQPYPRLPSITGRPHRGQSPSRVGSTADASPDRMTSPV